MKTIICVLIVCSTSCRFTMDTSIGGPAQAPTPPQGMEVRTQIVNIN